MRTSDALDAIAPALAIAQGQLKNALKDSENPHYRSKYADLTAIWNACREPLSSNGIAVLQDVLMEGDSVLVTTRLLHSSGQWIEFGPLPIPVSKSDAQGVGSATSYAKRYALSAAVGIASEDDDGEAAAKAKPLKKPAFDNGDAHTARYAAVEVFEQQDAEQQQWLREQALEIIGVVNDGGDVYGHVMRKNYTTEEQLALWSLLPSNVRSTFKKQKAAAELAAKTPLATQP